MICPHCATSVRFEWDYAGPLKIVDDKKGYFLIYDTCPNCSDSVVYYSLCSMISVQGYSPRMATDKEGNFAIESEVLIYPIRAKFSEIDNIPSNYIEDYEEALKVVSISPKASAALSRRLLQMILREEYKIKKRTLSEEIQTFINLDGVPSHLTDAVDAIRNIGNLAAHPEKDSDTGKIVGVEAGEAEWLIEVIEALFDFCFIQPQKLEQRRSELNEKLKALGKPLMKERNNTGNTVQALVSASPRP